ncbi:hypothetical protein [Escherichia phage vB_EcoS_011D2]|uniref:Uncharacterized protein n=2 Tax=Tlsvirus TaxID=1920865 RepID=A0A2H4P6P0_9CAUD|nr:hypothetical protein HOS51_gp75 [Salmonella phage YSP2]ATW57834.1 hypothetical protein YSP2_90 [Salmonella phage YSP2]QMP82763.1 hypothetical protein [Escherichia phage vB_EcoS_011D2]
MKVYRAVDMFVNGKQVYYFVMDDGRILVNDSSFVSDAIPTSLTNECFYHGMENGKYILVEKKNEKPFYKRGDFCANVALITIMLIFAVGFIFL